MIQFAVPSVRLAMRSSGKFSAPLTSERCNCHTRPHRPEHGGIGGVGPSVMRNEVHVDATDAIRRARQAVQRLAGEVADVEEPELAELQQEPRGPRVLGHLLRR